MTPRAACVQVEPRDVDGLRLLAFGEASSNPLVLPADAKHLAELAWLIATAIVTVALVPSR